MFRSLRYILLIYPNKLTASLIIAYSKAFELFTFTGAAFNKHCSLNTVQQLKITRMLSNKPRFVLISDCATLLFSIEITGYFGRPNLVDSLDRLGIGGLQKIDDWLCEQKQKLVAISFDYPDRSDLSGWKLVPGLFDKEWLLNDSTTGVDWLTMVKRSLQNKSKVKLLIRNKEQLN